MNENRVDPQLELLSKAAIVLSIKLYQTHEITSAVAAYNIAKALRTEAFKTIKRTGWTAIHSVLIPELTRIMRDMS